MTFMLQVNVRVTTLDAELEFSFHPNTTGKQLFDQVGVMQFTKHILYYFMDAGWLYVDWKVSVSFFLLRSLSCI